ncbi:hypothetical protein KP509_21G047000 [Ceratopteris richardii]|uniref:EGF-like domain-containing protein n=1 Tax=Ceratopteris richardii TaxID=49495 RepID=A0A8T2SD69_CERRI|nr:hypothetical protein KP509_21G047000 [Ceratopteris richardii]
MPNCSIDLACEGSSNSSALLPSSVTPPINNFSICSFPVCGNGKCTPIGSSLLAYDCKCDPGSLNIFNSSNGYCLEQCSLGAGCSNLNITLGGSPSPPPPPSSPQSQNSNQGIKQKSMINLIIIFGVIVLQMIWL